MSQPRRANALDHVVVVLFENRSFDNVLGRLYEPGDGKTFEGVIGKRFEQSDPGVGRARSRPQGGALRGRDRHGRAEPRLGRGVVPHQHAVVQHDRRAQPVQDRRGRDGAVECASGGCDADDGRVRHRLHQHLHRRSGPPADLSGVRPDHDRVHARAGTGAERHRARVRRLRPLVLARFRRRRS